MSRSRIDTQNPSPSVVTQTPRHQVATIDLGRLLAINQCIELPRRVSPTRPAIRLSWTLPSRLRAVAKVAVGLCILLLPLVAGAMTASQGGPLPEPLPLFPADNWWNLDI